MVITREDVKDAQGELGIRRTSAKTKDRVAQMHNFYANKILSTCTEDAPAEFRALAMQYASELPKASRGRDILEYRGQCEAKLDAFRTKVDSMGLGQYLVKMEGNAEIRHAESEAAAAQRHEETLGTIDDSTTAIIANDNANTAKLEGAIDSQTVELKRDNRRVANSAVRRINAHTTAEADRGIAANAQNTSAMLGVDAEGYTVKDVDNNRLLYNGNAIADDDSAVGRVNSHTDEVGDGINAHTTKEINRGVIEVNSNTNKRVGELSTQRQQELVLTSMRQGISDILGHEDRENGGVYRDKTVNWVNGAADRVMAGTDMTFAEKKEALQELRRMIDEETVISDGDRAAFESRYFYKTKERPHI